MTPRKQTLLVFALVGAAVLCAYPCAACPVCYGAPDSPATQGVAAAVFSLLGVTGGVLAVFASMFLRIRNRARALAKSETKL
jgi:hypothetical protein